jgi:hypothetical protein
MHSRIRITGQEPLLWYFAGLATDRSDGKGPPDFAFCMKITFPHSDIPTLVERLKARTHATDERPPTDVIARAEGADPVKDPWRIAIVHAPMTAVPEGIAALIDQMRRAGIRAEASSRQFSERNCIIIPTMPEVLDLLNIIGTFESSAESIHARILPGKYRPGKWLFEGIVNYGIQVNGSPSFVFGMTIMLPREDIATVTDRLKAYNASTSRRRSKGLRCLICGGPSEHSSTPPTAG